MKSSMKKKFDFSAEMNEAESIKATPKNEYLEEEKRLLDVNAKELASLNDNVHYMITNLLHLSNSEEPTNSCYPPNWYCFCYNSCETLHQHLA